MFNVISVYMYNVNAIYYVFAYTTKMPIIYLSYMTLSRTACIFTSKYGLSTVMPK